MAFRSTFVFFLFVITLGVSNVQARWATFDDADVAIQHYDRAIIVNKDGTSEETITIQAKILKDSGRNRWAHYPLVYNAANAKMQVLDAHTEFNNKTYPVDAALMEDKPLASSPHGFDQHHQILIAYPHAEIGATLHLKYHLKKVSPILENFYSTDCIYGASEYWEHSRLTVTSAMPLYLQKNDPKAVLSLTHNSTDLNEPFQKLEINLKQPVFIRAIDESGVLPPRHYPWISLSSMKDWIPFARALGKQYQPIQQEPLPPLFQTILANAKKHTHPIDQINLVTSQLAEKIQYMGDWTSIKGQFVPHHLDHIARNQLGDCKDYAISTAAILTQLGLNAHVALVLRGIDALPSPNHLPSFSGHFNHAMVKVSTQDNTIYWIDPTNFASMANGIFPDIADKPTLVLDPSTPRLERIPGIDPNHNQIILDTTWNLKHPSLLKAQGHLILKGEAALDLTGAQLQASNARIENAILHSVTNPYFLVEKSVSLPDLHSRIVNDLNIPYRYHQKNSTRLTTAGQAITIPSNWVNTFIQTKDHQVSDILIGPRYQLKKLLTLSDLHPIGQAPAPLTIRTPWIEVHRRVTMENNKVMILEEMKILKKYITSEELASSEYQSLKNQLKDNFNFLVVFKKDDH